VGPCGRQTMALVLQANAYEEQRQDRIRANQQRLGDICNHHGRLTTKLGCTYVFSFLNHVHDALNLRDRSGAGRAAAADAA
jgi:hypothetical protein